MPLNVGGECLDGWARDSNIIHSDYSAARELDKVEGISGEGEECVEEAELVEGVCPYGPETSNGVRFFVSGTVEEDGYEEFQCRGIDSDAVRTIERLNDRCPVDRGRLYLCE